MRLPSLLMGSLLLLPLACGDDGGSGDTGAADDGATGPTTGSSMTAASMTAADDDDDGASMTAASMTAADDDGSSMTMTTAPGDSSSGGPGDSGSGSSGEPPADSSGSGGEPTACETFCAEYFGVCGASEDNDYGDEASCVTTCDGYAEAVFMCKRDHLDYALRDNSDTSPHCGHANYDGGGQCPPD